MGAGTRGFNPAALEVIDFLGGDRSTGMCFCPCHGDGEKPSLQVNNGSRVPVVVHGEKPSLQVNNGNRVPVVVHCFGIGTKEHDVDVIAYLRANRKWPTSSALSRGHLHHIPRQHFAHRHRTHRAWPTPAESAAA